MVLYGLKSQIGTVYRNSDRTTSFYDIGNFLYLAGELNSRFWEDFVRQYGLDYKIRELYTSLHHQQHIVFMRISKKATSKTEIVF